MGLAEGVSKHKVLVVDDEQGMREFLEILLTKNGFQVTTASTGEEALSVFDREHFDIVIQDIRMPGMGGLALLKEFRKRAPLIPVLLITAYSCWDSEVEAMRLGASDYVRKPFRTEEICRAINRVLEHQQLREQGLGRPMDEKGGFIVGSNRKMREVFNLARQVASTGSTVLIQGESGTGKEIIARTIHSGSKRAAKPFISVNCAAFPESLLESELFGYKKGAFTGAAEDKEGLMVLAQDGTLFLDEIAEMSPRTQVKMLRVLEERRVFPLGGTREVSFQARVIAATNKDLEKEVKTGAVRKDLYYRLNVIPVHIPPLRSRKEDIPLLAGHLLAKYSKRMGKDVRDLSEKARETLLSYHWPGNVRELENVIQRYVALSEGPVVERIDLGSSVPGGHGGGNERVSNAASEAEKAQAQLPEEGLDLEKVLSEYEKNYINLALHKTGGNMARAAKLLGLTYRSIRYKVKKLGLQLESEVNV